MCDAAGTMRVQVCFPQPDHVFLTEVDLPGGATLEQAIRASGVLDNAPEIDLETCKVGVFGKVKPLDTILRASDRVEIYRPLQADPKEARRRRVAKKEKTR